MYVLHLFFILIVSVAMLPSYGVHNAG